jgi:Na+-transporting methylmalonyl-CoA/oxaloacetate decarboxylase gamma subunit
MPVETLLTASIELMFIGMGTVFIILSLLIGCMYLLSVFAPVEETAPACQDDTTIIAAIQSAIHHYRNRSAHKTAV